jgi:hypothetical protein
MYAPEVVEQRHRLELAHPCGHFTVAANNSQSGNHVAHAGSQR